MKSSGVTNHVFFLYYWSVLAAQQWPKQRSKKPQLSITPNIDGIAITKVIEPDDVIMLHECYRSSSFNRSISSVPEAGNYHYSDHLINQLMGSVLVPEGIPAVSSINCKPSMGNRPWI